MQGTSSDIHSAETLLDFFALPLLEALIVRFGIGRLRVTEIHARAVHHRVMMVAGRLVRHGVWR